VPHEIGNAQLRRARKWLFGAIAVAVGLLLAACGGSGSGSGPGRTAGKRSAQAGSKLIIMEMGFPCGLFPEIQALCSGARAAQLPPGYKLEIKAGKDVGDNVALNNLIQTSLQLKPAGLVVFPGGPAAQTPILNRACAQGVKIVVFSATTGVKCQSALVGADHYKQGANLGRWLIAHPPSNKNIGIATQPPGQFAATDDRVKGFKDTVTAAGFDVVATVYTDVTLDKTRTLVTNMMTAHPEIGTVFSGNGAIGLGVVQALKGKPKVRQVTLDFGPATVPLVRNGTLAAVANQYPFRIGQLAVETVVKVLQGRQVTPEVNSPTSVVDTTNLAQEIAASQFDRWK
jgi:ABC-type sugar transport system substrate-binding protein